MGVIHATSNKIGYEADVTALLFEMDETGAIL